MFGKQAVALEDPDLAVADVDEETQILELLPGASADLLQLGLPLRLCRIDGLAGFGRRLVPGVHVHFAAGDGDRQQSHAGLQNSQVHSPA